MLDEATVAARAAELHDAARRRVQVRHFSLRHPTMTIDDGYAVQRAWLQTRLAEGRVVRGPKIGLTPRAMQQSSQIDEPDCAPRLDDMFFAAGTVPFDCFVAPRVEVELVFVLARPLRGPGVTRRDVLAATEAVTPAVVTTDARIEQFDRETRAPRRVFDPIADFAANAGVARGEVAVRPDAVELRCLGAIVSRNGVVEETGLAAGMLDQPANGIAWLANKIAVYGEHLSAGDLVLAGSFTRPIAATRGDRFHVDYGALGAIDFHFA